MRWCRALSKVVPMAVGVRVEGPGEDVARTLVEMHFAGKDTDPLGKKLGGHRWRNVSCGPKVGLKEKCRTNSILT